MTTGNNIDRVQVESRTFVKSIGAIGWILVYALTAFMVGALWYFGTQIGGV